MKPSDFQKTVKCRFDCCLKMVVRGLLCDCSKELKCRKNKETLFCELPDIIIEKLAVWNEYDYNYTIFNGNMIKGLVNKYKKKCRKDCPNVTPYTFRYSFCTRLADAGMNPKALQYLMDYSNITITLNYYAHATFNSAKAEMERVTMLHMGV